MALIFSRISPLLRPARGSWIASSFASTALAALVAALTILTTESSAHATPAFPGVVQSHLGLSAAPDCTLCHVGTPSAGTVTTPFGATLRSRGARAYDEDALKTALDALAAEKKDSDGDGQDDITELREGADPNATGTESVTPEYGCQAAPSPRDDFALAAAILVTLGLCVALTRRRKARA